MVKYSVKQCRGKNGITHHLSPVSDLLVGGKDDGRSFISVADEGEETVCLTSADGRVTYFVDDDQLSFFDVSYPEARRAFRVRVVKEFDQVDHLFKADRVTAVDRVQAKPDGNHRLANTGRGCSR